MKKKNNKAKQVALYGILIATAMILSFAESFLSIPIPVPGVKLGLANLVTVAGLYLIGVPSTAVVTIFRIVLTGYTFGNLFSMFYGLSGSFLSLLVMALARQNKWFSKTGISILGGVSHNLGQLFFAVCITKTVAIFYYFPYLAIAGCITGCIIGILGTMILNRIPENIIMK